MDFENEKEAEQFEQRNRVFNKNLNSKIIVDKDFESREFDYNWISLFEDILPYIDNILRNPKRFIINEEEIVKVELAKKITVESVIHLTQHTNLIQDYDEKNADVRPSKILNINKEESLDTYENRFIFTLINNMNTFYDEKLKTMNGDSFYRNQLQVSYKGETKVGKKEVEISLHLNSFEKDITTPVDDSGETIEQRLKKIKVQLDGFSISELMQTLKRLHVPPVRSPIRKTNVILKNPNFQKAYDMWNYIQAREDDSAHFEREQDQLHDDQELKDQFDQTFLLEYIALDAFMPAKGKMGEKRALSLAISKIVKNILESNQDMDDKKIKEIFLKEFKNVKDSIKNQENIIRSTFQDKFKQYEANIIEAFAILD